MARKDFGPQPALLAWRDHKLRQATVSALRKASAQQQGVAGLLNVSPAMMSRILRGDRLVDWGDLADRIGNALGLEKYGLRQSAAVDLSPVANTVPPELAEAVERVLATPLARSALGIRHAQVMRPGQLVETDGLSSTGRCVTAQAFGVVILCRVNEPFDRQRFEQGLYDLIQFVMAI